MTREFGEMTKKNWRKVKKVRKSPKKNKNQEMRQKMGEK